MKTQFNVLWTLLLVAFVAMGAKITDNILSVGDGNPATDKKIDLSDGEIKWDQATSKLRFSNDNGSSFKDLGTGAGGAGAGINLLDADDNADFEALSLAPWVASAGSFIIETGTPGFDLQSASWDATGASENLDSALKSVPLGLENRNCNATIQYKYAAGSGGDYKMQVLDSGAAVITEKDIDVSTDWRKDFLMFTCPSAEQLRVRITSTADGGIILLDNVTLGKSDFVDLNQAELVAFLRYPNNAGCLPTLNSAAFTSFGASVPCLGANILTDPRGIIDNTDTDRLDLNLTKLTPGRYFLTWMGHLRFVNPTTGSAGIRIQAPAPVGTGQHECGFKEENSTGSQRVRQVTCQISFDVLTETGALNIQVQGFETSGDSLQIRNDANGTITSWKLVKYPLANAEAVNLETVGFEYEGYIDGASDITVTGGVAQTAFTPFANSGLTLHDVAGNADVSCDTGDNSGDTCGAGNEHVGIQINLPSVDDYEVCFSFSRHFSSINAAQTDTVFSSEAIQMADTDGTNPVISTTTTGGAYEGASNATGQGADSVRLCNTFRNVGGRKRFIFVAALQLTTSNSNYVLRLDDLDISGQVDRRVGISVRKTRQQMPTPVFTDLTDSLNLKLDGQQNGMGLFTARIANNGATCLIDTSSGVPDGADWISLVARTGAGACDIQTLTTFNGRPTCFVTQIQDNNNYCAFTGIPTSGTFNVRCNDATGSAVDGNFDLLCYGFKQ